MLNYENLSVKQSRVDSSCELLYLIQTYRSRLAELIDMQGELALEV
jgi:hypothetical protein